MIENPLPRPAHLLPPIMFRFNSEWYWADPGTEYTVWHDLMINGMMEPVVVAEIYLDGIDWQEWEKQPIFSVQPLEAAAKKKDKGVFWEETEMVAAPKAKAKDMTKEEDDAEKKERQ